MARCSIESPKYGIYIVRHKSVATGETFLVVFRPVLLISLVMGGAAASAVDGVRRVHGDGDTGLIWQV